MAERPTRLELCRLTVELPTRSGWICPVNNISFSLAKGETLGIVGESGSGKTILSLALMGLTPSGARCKGEAWLYSHARNQNGTSTAAPTSASPTPRENLVSAPPERLRALRGREISMIFQEPMTALDPVIRIGDQIAEAIRVHEPTFGNAEVRDRVLAALERASVPEPHRRARQYPHELSGGLRQRVLIAMALAPGPGVLIADEPTTALDVTVQKQILELLRKLRDGLELSMLFITHDLGVVAQVADRVAVMYAGRVVEQGPALEVLRHPRHPYTEGLLRAAPRLHYAENDSKKIVAIPGSVPALDSLPPGCSFAPRCSLHQPECDSAVPELLAVDGAADDHRARCILVRK
jgi:peptide/nickel transport system ATP-binding protein